MNRFSVPSNKPTPAVYLLLTCLLSAGCAGIQTEQSRQPSGKYMEFFRVRDTNGRVGYHMMAEVVTRGVPPDCDDLHFSDTTYNGSIPPGLRFENSGGPVRFEGTPRQPGVWSGTIYIGEVKCQSRATGASTTYGARTFPYRFDIAP